MELSRYLKIFPAPGRPGEHLLYSTKRGAMVVVGEALFTAMRAGSVAGEEAQTLTRLGFLVPDRAAEREEMRTLFADTAKRRRSCNVIVVLNLDCNLACPYCYEARFRGRKYMTAACADELVAFLTRERLERGLDLALSFYGGEPLLSLPLIRRISGQLQATAASLARGYRFSLVTNGTLLTRAVVAELTKLGLSGAKITLDGPRELHNRSRPFVSGVGSYDAILNNVRAVCDLVPLQLGGNFTQENYRRYPELLDELATAGVTPERVAMVQFAPVTVKAGERAIADFTTDCVCDYDPWLQEASLYLRAETLKRGYPAPKLKPAACMVELAADLVVGHDGGLYKCPAFMAYEHLRIGTLNEGIGDYGASHRLDLWQSDECLDCAYLPLCFGGCRMLTLARSGTIDAVDCRRELFDATLEATLGQDLEFQRMKKLRAGLSRV